ncbi:MAG: NHL repeat-containing protein, partial [Leptospira sp.]|nr:NHL repeat-containing protein [Leptospira sp.]
YSLIFFEQCYLNPFLWPYLSPDKKASLFGTPIGILIGLVVLGPRPSGLTYSANGYTFWKDSVISAISPAFTGSITGCNASPALPAGINIGQSDCALSGTPTSVSAGADYTITASTISGSSTAKLTIRVGSTTAISVYGQADFVSGSSNRGGSTAANSLSNPAGIVSDSSLNVYIGDGGNNRILYFPKNTFTATRVYGQGGNFTLSVSGFGANTVNSMTYPFDLFLDSQQSLYVTEGQVSRSLSYPTGNTTATRVFGQNGNFGSQSNNCLSANSSSSPAGVAVDSSGLTYIVDSGCNRILVYPTGSFTANRVYGQNGVFNTSTSGTSASTFNTPKDIALDSSNGLYVCDFSNNRVLYFPSGSTSATIVYGQNDFSSGLANRGGNAAANTLSGPTGIALDSFGGLYVVDSNNHRVLYFPKDSTSATRVFGQNGSFSSTVSFPVTADNLNSPQNIAIDALGGIYVTDNNNNRVLYY